MFCTNCGNQLADGSAFCSNCGARLIQPDAPAADAVPTTEPAPDVATVSNPIPALAPEPAPTPASTAAKKKADPVKVLTFLAVISGALYTILTVIFTLTD